MEELYQDQDQDTVIQQLRLLLASKEEELAALRGGAPSGGGRKGSDSIADRLLKELEEKKRETADLRSRMKDSEARSAEKLSRLAGELEERERIIASLKDIVPGAGAGGAGAAAAEMEEPERRIAALEEQLREKDGLLAAAGGESPAGLERTLRETEEKAQAEVRRLQEELRDLRISFSGYESLRDENEKIRAAAERLRAEHRAAMEREAEARRADAERIEELERRLELSGEGGGAPPPAPAEPAVADGAGGRLRSREEELEQREFSYRTAQAQLHSLGQRHKILRGVCAGLAVSLLFVLSMKSRQPNPVRAEAASLAAPVTLAGEEGGDSFIDGASRPDTPPAAPGPDTAKKAAVSGDEGPAPPKAAAVMAEAARPGKERIPYKVRKGESLWLICQNELGDGKATARIARENNLADPGAIKAGDTIYLTRD